MRRKTYLIPVAVCFLFIAIPLFSQPSLPTIRAVHESYARYQVEGVMLSDGSIRVLIETSRDGTPVFESRYPVEKADGRYLEWRYQIGSGFSRSTRLGESDYPTLEAMTLAAKDIVRMIVRGDTPESKSTVKKSTVNSTRFVVRPEDNYVCYSPIDTLISTDSGNCCDTLDACYLQNGCKEASWSGWLPPACVDCNLAVAQCLIFGIGSTGEKAGCCLAGNCGQPRPVGGGFLFPDGPEGPLTGPPDWDAASPGGGGIPGGSVTTQGT
jgi:hypothetical protein